MTTTKKQLETIARYKAMGWTERESSCKDVVLEKHTHRVHVLKNGKAVREVGRG